MKLQGIVTKGIGDYGQWITKFASAYLEKTGLDLYPGTLNILLPGPYDLPEGCDRLEREDYGGEVNVNIVPCRIFGKRGFILRTDANQNGTGPHPRTIIEVATDFGLRDAYSLNDGDSVTVEIDG